MIRINLLGVERQKVRKATPVFDPAQRATFFCIAIFGLTAMGIGAWYWQLSHVASGLTTEIAIAQAETVRLNKVLVEVKRAEERRAQLQQRVAIIEELRRGQSVPVQMLDHVSRSLPDFLWLTAIEQKSDAVNIEGQTTTMISLADFVANLGTSKLVEKPIDIIKGEVESGSSSTSTGQVDLIKFSVKAPLAAPPTAAKAAATPATVPVTAGAPR
jgi:type IV pilus assembly protein PilN